jgi:hypothetical protein
MSRAIRTGVALLALVAGSRPGAAQTVAEIVERMYAAAERQAEGMDDYTLVQRAFGFEIESYFEKELVEGKPVFRLKESNTEGFSFSLGAEGAGVGDVFLYGPELVEHGRYAGREEIAGSTVHVIAVDDLADLDIARPSAPGASTFVPKTARIYVDDAMMVPRRMEFTGDALTPAGPEEISVRVDHQAFLPVGSLFVPYRTVVEIEGLAGVIGPETMAQLEEIRRQLDALPTEERETAAALLGPRIEVLRQIASGRGDTLSVVITLGDVFINTGRVER